MLKTRIATAANAQRAQSLRRSRKAGSLLLVLLFVFLGMRRRYVLALTVGLVLSIPRAELHSQQTFGAGHNTVPVREALETSLPALIASRQVALGSSTMIGVAVLDANSGALLFSHNADQRFAAASNAKIITAATALDLLGSDFQFRTELLAETVDALGHIPGDLYIRGRGDASFDEADMVRLVGRLADLGVTRVDGDIVVDNSYFDAINLPPHFDEQPEEESSFRAPIAATSFTYNAWTLRVRPSLSGAGPARIIVSPANDYVQVVSTVSTIARGRTRLRMTSVEEPGHLVVRISGQIRREVRERRFRKRVPDPVPFVGTALRRTLLAAGITVRSPKIKSAAVPVAARVVALHQSLPLAVMIRGMGKHSNNFVAELVLKVVGAEIIAKGEPATWSDAQAAVGVFLAKVGLEKGEYRFENGSGLFDSNALTPMQLVKVLALAQEDFRWGPDLLASLAIAGGDGTLSRRMSDGPVARRIRAKTGTLDHASALSGVAAVNGNSPLIFSVLINGFPKNSVGIARALQNDIGEELIRVLNSR